VPNYLLLSFFSLRIKYFKAGGWGGVGGSDCYRRTLMRISCIFLSFILLESPCIFIVSCHIILQTELLRHKTDNLMPLHYNFVTNCG